MTPLLLLLSNNQSIPNAHCYLWQTPLVTLHVTADVLIAIAYCSIPIILIYFVRQIEALPFKNILLLFSAFILSCGTTHLIEIWVIWHPNYWLYEICKAITALISLYTAASLLPVIHQAIQFYFPEKRHNWHKQPIKEILEKPTAKYEINRLDQELEQKIAAKTSALIKGNQNLVENRSSRESIIDLTSNILYIFDLKTNRNIYSNFFVTELLGYTPDELQKFNDGIFDTLIHPEDLEPLKNHFNNCLHLEEDNYLETEYRIKNTNGTWHWLHNKNTIFSRNSQGEPEQILGIAQDITAAKKIELEKEELNQKLKEKIAVLETRDQTRLKLAQMNEFVRACLSLEEAQEVIADLLEPLFPDTAGVVYLLNNSKNIVDTVARWGAFCSHQHFDPKECWAIRLGNSHQCHSHTPGLYCSHIDTNVELSPTLCLPMIAKGETIGVLHLHFFGIKNISRLTQDLAETVAQNLALAFANLKLQEKLRYQSLRDPLTGLYNRRYLQEALSKEIDRAHRKQQFVSVIMLDVDRFKQFNDFYGHSAGDLVLKEIGAYLLSEIRDYDTACRYGGEELIVVMPDASIEHSIIRAEKIRAGIKNLKLKHEGKKLEPISVSIGVSCFPDDSINAECLIRAADQALYQAKARGRDCVTRC